MKCGRLRFVAVSECAGACITVSSRLWMKQQRQPPIWYVRIDACQCGERFERFIDGLTMKGRKFQLHSTISDV